MKLLLRFAIFISTLAPSVLLFANRPTISEQCEIPASVIYAVEYNYNKMGSHSLWQANEFNKQMIDLVDIYGMEQVETCFK